MRGRAAKQNSVNAHLWWTGPNNWTTDHKAATPQECNSVSSGGHTPSRRQKKLYEQKCRSRDSTHTHTKCETHPASSFNRTRRFLKNACTYACRAAPLRPLRWPCCACAFTFSTPRTPECWLQAVHCPSVGRFALLLCNEHVPARCLGISRCMRRAEVSLANQPR